MSTSPPRLHAGLLSDRPPRISRQGRDTWQAPRGHPWDAWSPCRFSSDRQSLLDYRAPLSLRWMRRKRSFDNTDSESIVRTDDRDIERRPCGHPEIAVWWSPWRLWAL